jgi:hypothetical protein
MLNPLGNLNQIIDGQRFLQERLDGGVRFGADAVADLEGGGQQDDVTTVTEGGREGLETVYKREAIHTGHLYIKEDEDGGGAFGIGVGKRGQEIEGLGRFCKGPDGLEYARVVDELFMKKQIDLTIINQHNGALSGLLRHDWGE